MGGGVHLGILTILSSVVHILSINKNSIILYTGYKIRKCNKRQIHKPSKTKVCSTGEPSSPFMLSPVSQGEY